MSFNGSIVLFRNGTDGGGVIIVPDGHGGFKIVHIPPWDPNLIKELGAAVKVITASADLRAHRAGQGILNEAGKIASEELRRYIEHVGAAHAGVKGDAAANVVVIIQGG